MADVRTTISTMRRIPVGGGAGQAGGRLSGDRGAAAVEFALVLPLLVMLIFGIYVFSMGYNAKAVLTGAVREGTRDVALGERSNATVQGTVRNASAGLNRPMVVTTIVRPCDPNDPFAGDAQVRATYNMTYSIPFFRSGTWTITAEAVMRCGL